jgi:YD repeat-containing protein
VRNIQSSKKIMVAATGKDPTTGKLRTEEYMVRGSVAVMLTTSNGPGSLVFSLLASRRHNAAERQRGLLTAIIDPAGGQTSLSYTGGKLDHVTDPAGRTTQFSVEANGDLAAIEAPDSSTMQFSYDERHRMQTKSTVGGGAVRCFYL